jgi:hypothetical protein
VDLDVRPVINFHRTQICEKRKEQVRIK